MPEKANFDPVSNIGLHHMIFQMNFSKPFLSSDPYNNSPLFSSVPNSTGPYQISQWQNLPASTTSTRSLALQESKAALLRLGGQDQGQYGSYQQPQQPYNQQFGGYPASEAGFGPPARVDSFGPPVAGGFQHGQEGTQFGMYNASNPQGNGGYFGPQSGQARAYEPFQQQQQLDPNMPNQHPTYSNAADPNEPFDPNAPEGERGIRHAIVGGTTGYIVGHKSGHGLVGAVGGAIVGDFLGDKRHEMRQHIRSSWGGGHSSDGHHSSSHHSSGLQSSSGGNW